MIPKRCNVTKVVAIKNVHPWNPKQSIVNGCFNWMMNQIFYIGNDWKSPNIHPLYKKWPFINELAINWMMMNQIFTSKRLFKKTSILNWLFGVLEVHKHKVTSAKLEGSAELGHRAGPGIYTGRIGSSALVV